MTGLHFSNALLCEDERACVSADEERSASDITHALHRLEEHVAKEGFIPNKVIGRAAKLVKLHHTLKYRFTDALRMRVVTVFLSAFQQKDRMQLTMRTKLLTLLCLVLKRSWGPLPLRLDWRLYWDEYMDVILRKDRHEVHTAEAVLQSYLNALCDFLLVARDFVDPFAPHAGLDSFQGEKNDRGSLVNYAMAKLTESRSPTMFEGVTLLFTLLPTNYAHYDALLPQWFALWTSLDNNEDWDYCWLTIVARARKHAKSFDWTPTLPFFLTCLRDLLNLPTGQEDMIASIQATAFPKGMPSFYRNTIQKSFAPDKDAVRKKIAKISKLLIFFLRREDAAALVKAESLQITLPSVVLDSLAKRDLFFAGFNLSPSTECVIRPAAAEIVLFLQSLRIYSHPSNNGTYVTSIAMLLSSLLTGICKIFGEYVAEQLIAQKQSSTQDTLSNASSSLDKSLLFSLDHLMGVILTFCFEGLYSKSPTVCQRYMLLLLDLLTLKPLYAHTVLPFFLAALDPLASTQPHQSRSAIQALSRTLKTMLFPNPVLLEYLPEILKLSLEFVHPSDVAKTSFALDLFTNVFAWLPVSGNGMCKAISAERTTSSSEKEGSGLVEREDLLRGSFPSYLQLFNVQTSGGSCASFSATESAVHLETLLQYLQNEWVSLFLDKVFALIDAQEKPVEGSSPPTTMHIVSRAIGFFFQAVDWTSKGDAQNSNEEVRNKIIKYVASSAPAHTAAVCAKMLECMLAADPSQLRTIISRLITEDLYKAEGNAEKLAFRVRVIGGCLRVATSEYIVPCFDLLRPLLLNMSLLCHEELSVREALAKLHKDVFKGCTASYPISYPVRCANSTSLACPNIPTRDDVRWHSPSTQSLLQSTAFLKETLSFLESNIRTALATATQPTVDAESTSSAAPLTLKRCEDMVASSLAVLCRVVRGVAEMIVDGEAVPVTATAHTTVTAQEGEEEEDNLRALRALPGTGRETLLERLSHNNSDSDRETVSFWRSLRARLLSLLNEVDESLSHTQPAFRGLRDSVFLAKQWTQCLSLVLTRRVAFVKSCEQAHTMLRHYKRAYRSQFVKEVHRRLRAHALFREELYDYSQSLSLTTQEGNNVHAQLLSLSHWKFHDIPVNDLVNRAWNQRSLRARALARASLTHSVRLDDASDLTTIALRKLLALTRHEFDAIRPQARKAFEGIAAHLGFKIVSLLRELLSFLYKPDATYVELASSLVLLKQSHAMRKIAADHQFKEMFLCSFVCVQRTCAQIEEADKREKAMLTLSDAFLKYTSMWQHSQRDLVFLQTQTIPQILQLLGVQRDGESDSNTENNDGMDVAETVTQLPATNLATTAAASVAPFVFTSNGLRLDVFLLYILLHSISSSSIISETQGEKVCSATQRGLWAVALQQVTRAQAQPVQSLGVSMLCRLAEALLVSQQREGDIENHEDIQNLFHFYGTTSSSSSSGLSIDAFLLGLARSNPRSLNEDSQGGHKEGSQQWSHGVSSALNATSFLRIVKPRAFSSKRYETNLCSAYFRKDVAAMVYSLAACGLLVRGWTRESDRTTATKRRQRNSDDELENKRMRANENDSVAQVKALLESMRELTVASESERRALNATRAELVAGLLRRLFELVTDAQRSGESERERELLACEAAVLQFLTQTLEPLSMDFARDWQEGMAFAFETHYSSSTPSLSAEPALGPIASHFASAFGSSLSSLCSDSTEKASESESASEDQDEGFTQHAKVLMLVNAIMHGDGSGKLFAQRESDLVFAERIARALKAPEVSLSLAYRALRLEMCSVLTSLLSYAPQSLDFERDITPKLIALLEQAQREGEREKEKESVSASTTVVSADSADASSSTTVAVVATSVTTSLSPAQRRKKHAIELASLLIRQATHYLPMSRAHALFLSLLPLLGDGLAHSDPDVVKSAGDAIKSAVLLMLPLTACMRREEKGFSAFGSVSPTSTFFALVTKYNEQTGTSWKVREFVHKLATSFMLCNWFCLSNEERKLLKDLFAQGVNDAHAAVQEAAKDGMVSYLCFKTGPELKTIADVYLRNSEALATREKQKKKTAKGSSIVSSTASKPDAQYWNVLQMISCVVQTSPYDLPAYLPALLVSFLRHAHYHDSSKQLLTKTMQVFQRTHQDRWEEFQKMFTPEQLQDLQGAGAAHYYA